MRDESSDEAPDAPEAVGNPGEMGLPHRPACDQCRHRKIGCDREVPCSNCTRAGIECRFTSSKRPKIRRQRVLISAQYERKIDAIEENLDQVIRLLSRLTTQRPFTSNSQLPGTVVSPANTPGHVHNALNPDAIATTTSTPSSATSKNRAAAISALAATTFEGDSSLNSQTAFANKFVENAVSNGPLRQEMRDALSALRDLVEARGHETQLAIESSANDHNAGVDDPLDSVPPRLRPLPPVELAMQTARVAQEDSRLTFVIFGGIMNIDLFISYMIRVYYPGTYTDADFIIVNAGLYTLFTERLLLEKDPHLLDAIRVHVITAKENFEAALSNLPLMIPATMDYVLALALGASVAIDTTSTALSSAATNAGLYLAQSLGYHRQQTMLKDLPETRNTKIWLFWTLYIMDKSISLRLGRPSTSQDYDITIPIPEACGDPTRDNAFIYTLIRWIKIAQLQGEVYHLLYSPGASSASPAAIAARANTLVASTHQVFHDMIHPTEQIKRHLAHWRMLLPPFMLDMCDMSDEVLYLTLLTMILRAVPTEPGSPSSFVDECILSARQALKKHCETILTIRPSATVLIDTYVKWTILYSPFLPFIVIFCHCIETSDQSDLKLLTDFVESLSGPAASSEATASQYRLFGMLETVARRYLDLKAAAEAKTPGTSMTPITANVARNEIDGYLHALGIVPTLQHTGGGAGSSVEGEAGVFSPEHHHHHHHMVLSGSGAGAANQGIVPGGSVMPISGQNPQPSLEDWFYSGQQLMGLWEENLF